MRLETKILVALSVFAISACSHFAPQPQVVYHRPELHTKGTKVVVMPVTDFEGQKLADGRAIESLAFKNWSQLYGAKNVIPGGPAIDKINEASNGKYIEFLKSLDSLSVDEQTGTRPELREYVSKVSAVAGGYNLAFTIVEGDKEKFNNGQPVRVHLGLYDTKHLTWRWITKIEDKKSLLSDWTVTSTAMISNSFQTARKVDRARNNMARMPASK